MKFIIHLISLLFCLFLCNTSALGQLKLEDFYTSSENKFHEGKYAEALALNIKALKLAEKRNNCAEITHANMQVARMQYYLNHRILALSTLLHSEKLIDSCGIDSLRHKVYHNIGSIYSEIQQLDSSLLYLKKALSILNGSTLFADIVRSNIVIAALYIERKQDAVEGDFYLRQAEKYLPLTKDSVLLAFTISKRGRWYYEKKDFTNTLLLYNKALSIYRDCQNANGILYMLRAIADTKAKLKTDDILESYRAYILLKDSIFSQETAKKIAEYGVQYETEKKEIQNANLQQKLIINQAKIKNRNSTITVMAISLLLVIILILWQINVTRFRKKQAELKRLRELQLERERISRDLHDNVGGHLSYVLFALDGLDNEHLLKRKIIKSNIDASIRSVIEKLRETIWAISEEEVLLSDFSDKLKVYARNMFRNTTTELLFSVEHEAEIQLKATVGLNAFRICQEIVNNAFKYAHATKIEISIRAKDQISIQISDNGVGFDLEFAHKKGYGLANIKKRANEAAIQLTIDTSPGKGTKYTMEIQEQHISYSQISN